MRLNCQKCEQLLSGFADSALSETEASDVQDHLERCDACRRQLDDIETLKKLLCQSETPEPRDDFWSSALTRVEPRAARRRRTMRVLLGFRVAVVAVVGAVIGYAMLRHPDDMPAATSQPPAQVATFDPAGLVSLHASARAGRPFSDPGKIRFAIGEGHARDYAHDDRLDSQ